MLSIQDVTKQTGVTVRTLRYYDEIDLLRPAGKTDGGHRLYGEKELKKLQEIQFLKTLGFRLREIKEMLADEKRDWAEGLHVQLTYILKEKEKLIEIENKLKGLINGFMIDEKIDVVQLQRLIQLYQTDKQKREAFREQIFKAQELELLEKLPNMNRTDPDSLEWISLVAQLKRQMHKGKDAPEIQRIIRRMHEKSIEAFGENEPFMEKIWNIRKSSKKSQEAGFYPLDDEVIEFFEEAWDVYEKERGNR